MKKILIMSVTKVLVVNVLTFSRFIFSLIFAYYIMIDSSNIIPIVLLFTMICATDFFDGRLARKLMVTTKLGAVFDVIADLFFITTSYSVLIIQNIIPVWVLVMVLLKFLEFCITSFIAKKTDKSQNSVFLFDMLGRVVVLLFYAIPVQIILLKNYLLTVMFYPVVGIIGGILTIMALISSFYRINMCLKPVRPIVIASNTPM